MLISVIVPTYNGAQKLGNILSALANQTFKEFELLIAVDGSTDATMELLGRNSFGGGHTVISTRPMVGVP